MLCPSCSASIPIQNINIRTDVGQCTECGHVFLVSENLREDPALYDNVDLDRPPDGVWIRHEVNRIVLGATKRGVPFMLVWSGDALGGIYGT